MTGAGRQTVNHHGSLQSTTEMSLKSFIAIPFKSLPVRPFKQFLTPVPRVLTGTTESIVRLPFLTETRT